MILVQRSRALTTALTINASSLRVVMASKRTTPDALDVAVELLKRREGIDKTLKLIRYVAIFAASETSASSASSSTTNFSRRMTALERSIGDARRAYRLGKFLGNVAEIRDELREGTARGVSRWRSVRSAGAACAALEGAYYFMEQGVWLSKSGVAMREKTTYERLVRWSARFEVASYAFSVFCAREDWLEADARGRAARRALFDGASAELRSAEKGSARGMGEDEVEELRATIEECDGAKREAVLSVIQDVTDATLSFEDALDVEGVELSNERLVNVLGLLAAVLDFHGKLSSAIASVREKNR